MDRINGNMRPDYGQRRYYYVSQAIKNEYGIKLEKLMLDGGFTCPNRDGYISYGGCIFCSAGGSGEFSGDRNLSIKDQIKQQLKEKEANGRKADGYIAYFQAFTGTYAPVTRLEKIYREAMDYPGIKVLSIATRPDCLQQDILDLLERLNSEMPVWVELGLQTMHKSTAGYIRRGYELDVFEKAVRELNKRNIKVIVHLILGLPGENSKMVMETIDYINGFDVWGVKLQLLHILKGTGLEKPFYMGDVRAMEMHEYAELVCDCIGRLRPDIVIHRITGDGPKEELIAPLWSCKKRSVLNKINHMLKEREIFQGKNYAVTNESWITK